MGVMSNLRLVKQATPAIDNQYPPAVMTSASNVFSTAYEFASIDIDSALQVPTISRCDQILTGIIGGIPLELKNKKTGATLEQPAWLDQPDIRQPRSVTMAYTARMLRFHAVAYWEVTAVYGDDKRPARFAWVNNSRVVPQYNKQQTEIEYYQVDGTKRPNDGVGSLVTFQSLLPGVLNSGARTIRAALDLEKAAAVAAATPMATTVIKNSGADLSEAQVLGILAAWKSARQKNSTAYLTSTLEASNVGFSPKDMMYVDAKQALATECCRLMNMPPYMASADASGNSMTYQNVLEARKELFAYSIAPYVNAIEDRLSMNDITNSQTYVKFCADDTFLRADTTTRLAVLEKMLALQLITLDQAKEMEDLTPEGASL